MSEPDPSLAIPAFETMTGQEVHPETVEALQPGAQQRRGPQCPGEHPPARADERFLPERFAPCAHRLGREGLDGGREPLLGRRVPTQKLLEWFAVREVEPASAGDEKLATR